MRERLAEELGEERADELCGELARLEEEAVEAESSGATRERNRSTRSEPRIIGGSEAMRRLLALVPTVAASSLPVLILGETGTGKELIAGAIHRQSPRRGQRFLSVSCVELSDDLLEAELLGYRRGAFTGAERDHDGLLVRADGGTLFLDEIADMSPALQAMLLRVLDRAAVRLLGSEEEVPIDVRFLFSTNQDLSARLEEGSLRRDLVYRVEGMRLTVPPLRERLEDLPGLVESFRASAGIEDAPRFDESAIEALAAHSWPGNVRELRNAVLRLLLGVRGTVRREHVGRVLRGSGPGGLFPPDLLRKFPLERLVHQLSREYLMALFEDCAGDIGVMASRLGISVRALYKRFRKLDLRPRDIDAEHP